MTDRPETPPRPRHHAYSLAELRALHQEIAPRPDYGRNGPEAVLYFILRYASMLQADGMHEAGALHRIDSYFSIRALTEDDHQLSVDAYIRRVLARDFPSYSALGKHLVSEALMLAHRDLDCLKVPWPFEFPRSEWRKSLLSFEDFENEVCDRHNAAALGPASYFEAELVEFVIWIRQGDELWNWSSPRQAWQLMMGQAGVCLVRTGRSIGAITTMLN